MRSLLLAAIVAYQRYISPYKGFRCAYCAHTGRASCSALGYRAIRRFGVYDGIGVLQERLFRCGVAHRRYRRPPAVINYQAGECDPGCDWPCEFDKGKACDTCDCLSDLADCGRRKRRSNEEENEVQIPPRRGGR